MNAASVLSPFLPLGTAWPLVKQTLYREGELGHAAA